MFFFGFFVTPPPLVYHWNYYMAILIYIRLYTNIILIIDVVRLYYLMYWSYKHDIPVLHNNVVVILDDDYDYDYYDEVMLYTFGGMYTNSIKLWQINIPTIYFRSNSLLLLMYYLEIEL